MEMDARFFGATRGAAIFLPPRTLCWRNHECLAGPFSLPLFSGVGLCCQQVCRARRHWECLLLGKSVQLATGHRRRRRWRQRVDGLWHVHGELCHQRNAQDLHPGWHSRWRHRGPGKYGRPCVQHRRQLWPRFHGHVFGLHHPRGRRDVRHRRRGNLYRRREHGEHQRDDVHEQ